ncbi:hypothetical protein BJF92_11480 [Rhizobium rhizosphaerae]|uniref:Uncharacterized protein n=1 Tax=Xaviernesmea rhizosphaerae TaxID=1672749 RepID=A0A1Q9AMS8_9HYPH|nr:hypothetical protein [Xaviernesmea rhizosphaerae]OLP56698.1 hypothetical protein BJF92_11480 [Xaviernesmea rhizosphaerae]
MEFTLLVAGATLLVFGLYFVARHYPTSAYALVLIMGVTLLVMGVLRVSNAKIAFIGFELNFNVAVQDAVEAKNTANNVKDNDIPRLNIEIQKAQDALEKQADINRKLVDVINGMRNSSSLKVADINDQGALFKRNSGYTVLVFYRDSRRDDAVNLQSALTAAGYPASSIMTDLSEAKIAAPPQSTVIVPSQKGVSVSQDVLALTKSVLPPSEAASARLGDSYRLQRGDLQILLF